MLHTARPDPTATYAAFQGPGHQHVLVYAYGLEACAMVELCMFGDRRVLALAIQSFRHLHGSAQVLL